MEGEERGDWSGEVVLGIAHRLPGFCTAKPSGGNEHLRGAQDGAIVEMDGIGVRKLLQSSHLATSADLDAVFVGRIGEAVHDGFGEVGGGEHAPVSLGLELDPTTLKPGDGVGGIEAVEGAVQALVAAGIVLHQFAWVGAVMGDIAASSAGDTDLGENLF